jgi:hypothetical protein
MAFTASELASIANAALDFHWRGQPLPQTIQEKPLVAALESARKTFPGGKGDITRPVKGVTAFEAAAGSLTGYSHDDTVLYGNIAGIDRVTYPWREMHTGFNVTHTELKIDGISVVDSVRSERTSNHSKRELTAITNIMQDKVESFSEIVADELNTMLWGDGTGDPLGMLGVQAFVTDTPAVGTTGGIDRSTSAWWRNRYLSINPSTTDIPEKLHSEWRQLRRYGGRPNLVLAGSDFLDALITQLRAKGYYTDQGWSKPGSTDLSIADVSYMGVTFQYDPTLDDLSASKSCYVLDTRHLHIYAMDQEWGKDHTPARPHDQYALYKAKTYTGQLTADQLNCHGLYVIP